MNQMKIIIYLFQAEKTFMKKRLKLERYTKEIVWLLSVYLQGKSELYRLNKFFDLVIFFYSTEQLKTWTEMYK